MAEPLVVELTRTIRVPLATVSRQFGDMKHHERHQIHRGITIKVLSEDGPVCRFRQELRLLGMTQAEEVVQERLPDGSLKGEIVSGTNAGGRIRQTFAAKGADATDVTFRIEIPVHGLKALLRPLFAKAVAKAVLRAFEEDRVDLEGRGYPRAA